MNLICISGSSGVGKTTLSKIIQNILGTANTVCLSGDDLHKWERNNPVWGTITHLHPDANNIDKNYQHLAELKSNNPIDRCFYNHDTGKFDDPVRIYPKEHIIYEGLHALYHRPTNELSDLNIYVDTEEDLKTEWKFKRDVKNRGYSPEQVRAALEARKKDEIAYIEPQKKDADVIVKFTKIGGTVDLQYICITHRGISFMARVKYFYDAMNDFLKLSRWLSLEPSLVQGRGGNLSIKSHDRMVIKSSGMRVEDINLYNGYCVLEHKSDEVRIFGNEPDYTNYIRQKNMSERLTPSMETGFHLQIPNKYVVHTHPIHLNAILCSHEVKDILNILFHDIKYEFINYVPPGLELFKQIHPVRGKNNIFLLQNHGLIIGTDILDEAIHLTEFFDTKCKKWFADFIDPYIMTSSKKVSPLFPDAAIFEEEMSVTNHYILKLIGSANLTPNFLTMEQIQHLRDMPSEKFRKSLV